MKIDNFNAVEAQDLAAEQHPYIWPEHKTERLNHVFDLIRARALLGHYSLITRFNLDGVEAFYLRQQGYETKQLKNNKWKISWYTNEWR